MGFPGGLDDKESACNAGDLGPIPGLGRSPGEGNGCPLLLLFLPGEFHGQRSLADYSLWAAKCQTQLSNQHFHGSSEPLRQSVQFSCSVVSHSLRPHGLQHTSFLCPLPTPRACSNSCPLSRWWWSIEKVLFWFILFKWEMIGKLKFSPVRQETVGKAYV